MSQQKFKSENYQNFGGINQKISQYDNSPLEFLDIKNFDFQTPGALTARWGSTQYVSQGFSAPISTIYEYSKLDGSSYVVVGTTGALWSGATTGQSQGLSLSTLTGFNATIGIYAFNWPVIFSTPSNVNYMGSTQYGAIFSGNGIKLSVFGSIQGGNKLSSKTFTNTMYAADGNKFFKFDGTNTFQAGQFYPVNNPANAIIVPSNLSVGLTVGIGTMTLGTFSFYASYLNNTGQESQIWPVMFINGQSILAAGGNSFIIGSVEMLTPPAYGISSINVYSYFSTGTTFAWAPNYVLLGNYPASGSTTTTIPIGTSIGNFPNLLNNSGGIVPDPAINNQQINPAIDFKYSSPTLIAATITAHLPKYLEVFQNRLFSAGVSTALSTLYFSEVTNPDTIFIDSSVEVRTNDADYITAIKAYGTRLYIFKKNSLYALIGDNPSNFSLQEVTLNYGCLNNRSVIVYEQNLIFLDRKGVMIFNGTSISTLSDKVQPIFDRMNYAAALDVAIVEHDKLRNQILIAIPVDGSTVNNIIVVYDYLNKSWTTQDGYTPTVLSRVQGRNNTQNIFYGTPTGALNWFGPSFLADNSSGFTSYFKTRYLNDMGESVEKQFRRLYLNADSYAGVTYTMPVNFFADYSTSPYYGTTFLLGQFQNRIDFGIPAKAMAFEISNLSTTSRLRIYGFTIESRMQRRV